MPINICHGNEIICDDSYPRNKDTLLQTISIWLQDLFKSIFVNTSIRRTQMNKLHRKA